MAMRVMCNKHFEINFEKCNLAGCLNKLNIKFRQMSSPVVPNHIPGALPTFYMSLPDTPISGLGDMQNVQCWGTPGKVGGNH